MAEKFLLVGTKAALPATRDANKLYWVSDTRELYKGMDLYTEAVRVVADLPSTPATGVLYILPTGEVKSWTGTAWSQVAKPYVTDGTLSATNTSDEVPTAKVVYDSIVEAITEATAGGEVVNNIASTKAGLITVTSGVDDEGNPATYDVAVKGAVVNPTYDADTRTITLPYADGTESLVITLGKDIFIDHTADNKYNPDTQCIELFLNDGNGGEPTKISIPAASLVDVYTGGTTSTAVVSVATDTNVITADVRVSAKAGNRLTVNTTEGEEGLMVDVSDLAKAADLQTTNDNVTALDERVTNAEAAIEKLNADATTEGSVDYKIAQAQTNIKTTTDALAGRLDTLEADENTSGSVANAVKTANAYTDDALTWGTF